MIIFKDTALFFTKEIRHQELFYKKFPTPENVDLHLASLVITFPQQWRGR